MLSPFVAVLLLAQQPTFLHTGMTITTSGRVAPGRYSLPSTDESGKTAAITIKGDNIDIDFGGAEFRGTSPQTLPDQRKGTALLIEGNKVTIRNLKVRGYKIAVIARGCENLSIVNSDFSYNWKQHLLSDLDREDTSDWMSFHKNEQNEWLGYGAGIYLDSCKEFKIRDVKITGGQCGLMMTNCSNGLVFNNDFSFLSAIGVGLYRTSDCLIESNKIDWCVRGYSHGVYNRGQDSAGILIYEQSNHNVFAYNSVTHGGDGFFLWAGNSTMDTGQGGCNDNLCFGNDFSHAPTNGIEATFSRNKFIYNLVQECWHGVWGGYSYGTQIIGNRFSGNAEAIAIEHGQDNRIENNTFNGDRTAINLWQNATQDPNWGYPKARDTRSRDYTIRNNIFEDIATQVFRFKGVSRVEVSANTFRNNGPLVGPEPVAREVSGSANRIMAMNDSQVTPLLSLGNFLGTDLKESASFRPANPTLLASGNDDLTNYVPTKDYLRRFDAAWNPFRKPTEEPVIQAIPRRVPGLRNPFLRGGVLRGRRYILVDEWGPYDFRSPRLWLRETKVVGNQKQLRFEVLGPRGNWTVGSTKGVTLSETKGQVPGELFATITPGVGTDIQINLKYVGQVTTDFLGNTTPAGITVPFEYSRFEVPQSWQVYWWNYDATTQDPRNNFEAFDQHLAATEPVGKTYSSLSFDWWNSPAPGINADHFATRALSTISLPPGKYIFDLTADDGVRMWIADNKVIDEWHYSGPTTYSYTFTSDGSPTKLRIDQFELDGFSTLKLRIRKAL